MLSRFFHKTPEKSLLCIGVGALAVLLLFTCRMLVPEFNSDVATANLLAREQVRNWSIFPADWVYAQDIWMFFLNIPISFFSLFTSNQILLRLLAMLSFVGISILSVVLFFRKYLKSAAWLYALPLLYSYWSVNYFHMVFIQCAYLPVLFYMLLALSGLKWTFDECGRMRSPVRALLFFLFVLHLSAGGFRYVQMIQLPLIGAVVIVYLFENKQDFLKKNLILPQILQISIMFLAMVLGLLLYFIIAKSGNYKSGAVGMLCSSYDAIISNFHLFVKCMLHMVGFEPSVQLLSLQESLTQ